MKSCLTEVLSYLLFLRKSGKQRGYGGVIYDRNCRFRRKVAKGLRWGFTGGKKQREGKGIDVTRPGTIRDERYRQFTNCQLLFVEYYFRN